MTFLMSFDELRTRKQVHGLRFVVQIKVGLVETGKVRLAIRRSLFGATV